MDRAYVIAALKGHETELRELGIARLSLFGSTGRGEATRRSDVDIAVELAPGARGFAHLDRIQAIKDRLAEILGVAVDVIEEPSDLPRVQQAIERDRFLAFLTSEPPPPGHTRQHRFYFAVHTRHEQEDIRREQSRG